MTKLGLIYYLMEMWCEAHHNEECMFIGVLGGDLYPPIRYGGATLTGIIASPRDVQNGRLQGICRENTLVAIDEEVIEEDPKFKYWLYSIATTPGSYIMTVKGPLQ
jgi:hypothetical protein